MKLICHLLNGYPTLTESAMTAEYYAAGGCKILQIGLPARKAYTGNNSLSDNMALALVECDNYDHYLDNITEISRYMPHIRIMISADESTVKEIGIQKFIRFCRENNISDVTLTVIENHEIIRLLIENGLKVSGEVSDAMSPDEIESIQNTNGFILLKTNKPEHETLIHCIKTLKKISGNREIFCGDITTLSDYSIVAEAGADGAFLLLDIDSKDSDSLIDTVSSFKDFG
ncbi:MAG TPA: hypothetical protein DEB10_09445 [Ruminococcaceae bacterium]|jgi:tryptophan synthase alpha chain|nr:hypothetical protein [Oscillospiraceae bacterium]